MNGLTLGARSELQSNSGQNRLLFLYDGDFDVNNGVSSYIRTIGEYASAKNCSVDYLVGRDSLGGEDVTSFSRIASVSANGSRSVVPIYTPQKKIEEALAKLKPNAVHVQAPYVPFMGGKVIDSLDKSTTLVGTFHATVPGRWLRGINALNAHLTKGQLKRFDALFSVSESAQATAKDIYGVDTEILPCPVDPSLFNDNSFEQAVDETVTITFIGRMVARKGISTFINSLRLLDDDTLAQIEVNIIGDGHEKESIEREVAQTELSPITRFMGQVDDNTKNRTLENSDIVVATSSGGESFGIVLIEAMAAGRPIVLGSDISGYSEVLHDSPESLVPRDRPDELARKLTDLIHNSDKRAAAREAQQKLVDKYDIRNTIGPRLMQAYGFSQGDA